MKKLTVLASLLIATISSASMVRAGEDSTGPSPIGTWALNLKESIAPQGQVFGPYTVIVRRSDEILDFTYLALQDGKPYEFSFSGKADGTVRDLEGGLKAAMIRLPSGNYEARLWMPDGSYENKFCQLLAGGNKNLCLATVTEPDGSVVFFKQVQDRQ